MAGNLGKHKAFSMLELLVAMVLMVVIASCLYTALYTAFRAKRSAMSAVEPTSLAINAIDLIKQDTYGVLPAGGILAGSFIGTDSLGVNGVNADSLEFYTTHIYSENDHTVGGLGKIELVLEEDTDYNRENYRLVRRITTNLLSPRPIDPEEQVLCRNVKSLNLRYFNGDSWLEEWDSTADANSLPLAMEIDIQVLYNTTSSNKEPQIRRLTQSFAIPCGGAAQEESQAESGGSGLGGS
ncbi:MAG: prepilin-type N-terminal cleavage/methylation domain-containing protein [Planctomycetes bacterium]|nr:prepilin-type N-terminal cleavage/methylation domain-containing protein [Planctomycetota bacterium]MBL7144718.1 prepilin-type N-terminal cleavage/methylation domain-containing protein [Phycisphaerae bacterium]